MSTSGEQSTAPADVLAHWSRFAGAVPKPFGTGLINKTFLVEKNGDKAVFQRLHPVFAGSVNEDIDATTTHLANKGLLTPRLLKTDAGAFFVDDPDSGRPWRALSFVPGRAVDAVREPQLAFAGAALVARFHLALADLQHDYRHVRAGVHDTGKHMATLKQALDAHRAHRLYAEVAPLAERILATAATLPDFSNAPLRHCHGDLKISNLLFDDDGNGACLVDLDTLGRMPLAHELGDALRSWTNPVGEDNSQADVDERVFAAAVEGYASVARDHTTADEHASLVGGMLSICVELSARFCADALNESYFGFDASRYPSRGAHNLVRAQGQFALAEGVRKKRSVLEAAVQLAFVGIRRSREFP
jgi:Ser/Thr protein kinase RdoA (MazF antagonist)